MMPFVIQAIGSDADQPIRPHGMSLADVHPTVRTGRWFSSQRDTLDEMG